MFHNYFKCEDILQQVGLCPQEHKVLGKLATNLTFLTYLIGRLDLTRFRLIWCQTLVTLQAGQRYELRLCASTTGII